MRSVGARSGKLQAEACGTRSYKAAFGVNRAVEIGVPSSDGWKPAILPLAFQLGTVDSKRKFQRRRGLETSGRA